MRVVFFGTPEFAVPSLQALVDEGADVVAVVTQPDRPQGRSRSELVPSPIKVLADSLRIPVLQPERPRGDLFLAALRRFAPDLGVLVAYGNLLPSEVLELPPRGMINVHPSLLPRHRGAAPIQATILAGDPVSGVTIMQMDAGMDSGDILHLAATPVGANETEGELAGRLARLGAQALVETLVLLQRGEVHPVAQDHAKATFAPKFGRDDGRIRWEDGSVAVSRRIRAFDPVPGAWSLLDDLEVKLFGVRILPDPAEPGLALEDHGGLVVGTGDGTVAIAEVQPAGKRRMAAGEWIRGRGIRQGQRFS